jgi:nitrate/nitrite transport system ATP-binding protein
MSALVRVEGLTKQYPGLGRDTATDVFSDLCFAIDAGEFVCLVGHSGCGKTTVLNIMAGLDRPSSGAVIFGGREVDGPSLDRAVIFQSHALLPWFTVLGNIVFAVRSRQPAWPKAKVREHARRYVELVGLAGNEHKRPAQLSGGMKQRVGIARALSIEPRMLLMDEPFSALDALTRGNLQDEVLRLCAATQQTVFMITHDVDEAILLADKIMLMTNGPAARIAEIVVNTLPRTRSRSDLHRQPLYYAMRNHLMDFLVDRSRRLAASAAHHGSRQPPMVSPGLAPAADVANHRRSIA